jgi:hypothetical protein
MEIVSCPSLLSLKLSINSKYFFISWSINSLLSFAISFYLPLDKFKNKIKINLQNRFVNSTIRRRDTLIDDQVLIAFSFVSVSKTFFLII